MLSYFCFKYIVYGLTETGRALEAILVIVPVGLSLDKADADSFLKHFLDLRHLTERFMRGVKFFEYADDCSGIVSYIVEVHSSVYCSCIVDIINIIYQYGCVCGVDGVEMYHDCIQQL